MSESKWVLSKEVSVKGGSVTLTIEDGVTISLMVSNGDRYEGTASVELAREDVQLVGELFTDAFLHLVN